jgi:pyrroloquinoline quinone (PQQ) biosynthesis protein C
MPETVDDATREAAAPVEDYLREIEGLIAGGTPDRVRDAVAGGRASRDVVRRVVLEHYCVAKWTTPEMAVLIANAPDVHRFTMDHSTHYRHWARRFADETGYLAAPGRLTTAVEWARGLGASDEDIAGYAPLPQTIAFVCTVLFYVRRTYEEGVAAVLYTERGGVGRASDDALRAGLAAHYGVAAPAPGAGQGEPAGPDLLRMLATTRTVQDRCRVAIRNVASTAACRAAAMNRWVE